MRGAGKSVLILEKTYLVGATTVTAGGVMWVPANRVMAEAVIPDSAEAAARYLDATVGVHPESAAATPERRATYVREARRMVDFLVEQGIRLGRSPHYPDYYDDRPGGFEPGRTVVADLFDLNELGEWKDKLRPCSIAIPAPPSDLFEVMLFKRTWRGKLTMLKIRLKAATAKLTGKHWATGCLAIPTGSRDENNSYLTSR